MSPSTTTPGRIPTTRMPAAQRRAEILHRSARLFQQRGYTGVSIDDIGADIGISGPALYRHVRGKEAILFEIGIGFLDDLLAVTDRALADNTETETAGLPQRLIDAVVALCLDRPAELTVALRHLWGLSEARFDEVRERWTALGERYVPMIVAAYPHLEPHDAGLYVRAAGGSLINAARVRNVAQPRLVELGSTTLKAMLATPLEQADGTDTPTEPRPKWARSSRREQILDIAIDLFRERGYRGVSVAEIAEAIGVTAAAPYRHFKNKEDILATAILRTGERVAIGMGEALDHATSADDALDRLLRSYVGIAVDNMNLFAVTTTEYHHIAPDAKAQRRRHEQLFVEEWTHCLATTRPDLSSAEAVALVNEITGLVTESVRSRSLARRPHLADDLYRLAHAVLQRPMSLAQ